jgi:L-ascorbate metabolism protein UlaG (beta-lactamase superfamily)
MVDHVSVSPAALWLQRSTWRRRFATACVVASLLVTACTAGIVADGWVAFGVRATGARLERMTQSPQYRDGRFENVEPMWNNMSHALLSMVSGPALPTSPSTPVPIVDVEPELFSHSPASGLRVTWLGHSATILEIDGVRLLTDPVFGGRASPFSWAGPAAWYEPPLLLDEVPPVDAILVSHDHHDHLQHSSIARIVELGWQTTFIAPLGVGAHLESWGIPADRIVELDWWDIHPVTSRDGQHRIEVVSTPARHASGRHVFDQMATLWTSYALKGPQHRVFFSGDTGLTPAFVEIGARHGPFDVVMVEVGAYDRDWPDWHMGPEQALVVNEWTRGKLFVPIHWGLWTLASHGWTEPVERILAAAPAHPDLRLVVPRPGQSIEVTDDVITAATPASLERWWPDVPWQTAAEHPVVATRVPGISPVPDPRVDVAMH